MNANTIELLVVEDNEKHLADARNYFAQLEQNNILKVDYAGSLEDAKTLMAENNYSGIISDVFFSIGGDSEKAQIDGLAKILKNSCRGGKSRWERNYVSAMETWINGETEPPAGVYVAKVARDSDTPVVLNTDSGHHGELCEPVTHWTRYCNDPQIELVDSGTAEGSADAKEWAEAYAVLVAEMGGISYYELRGTLKGMSLIPKLQVAEPTAKEQGLDKVECDGCFYNTADIPRFIEKYQEKVNEHKSILEKYFI